MLHHGSHSHRRDGQDGGDIKLRQRERGQPDHGLPADAAQVHHTANQRHNIGDHNAQQDGNDLDHSLAPDVGHDDDSNGKQRKRPAALGIVHCRAGQIQTDEDDHRTGNDGREKPHDLFCTHCFKQQRQQDIQTARHHDAAHGIGQLFGADHIGKLADIQFRNSLEASQKGKGRAEKCGDFELCAHVENQRADTCEEQGRLDGQGQPIGVADNDGYQNRGTEHCEHMLETQNEHSGPA